MKLIIIVLFQIFLFNLVLELESVSNDLTINLVICQKQSSKCCRCSGIYYNNNGDYDGDIDGDNGDGDDGDNGDGDDGDDNGDGDGDYDGGDENGDGDNGDGDLNYNNNYEYEETDPIKGINIIYSMHTYLNRDNFTELFLNKYTNRAHRLKNHRCLIHLYQ